MHRERLKMCFRTSAALLALAAGAPATLADEAALVAARPGVLSLRTGQAVMAPEANLLLKPDADFGRAPRHVIALDGPMDPVRRARLAAAGVRLGGYLPTNAFIADLSGADIQRLLALPFVTWIGEFDRAWKIAPSVAASRAWAWRTPSRAALAAEGRQALRVTLFEGADGVDALDAVRRVPGVEITLDETLLGSRALTLRCPAGAEEALADLSQVQCVEPVPEYLERSNSTTRWVVQSNVSLVTPFYTRGLTGQGQIIGVVDSPVRADHCSFLDAVNPIGPLHRKILAYNAPSGSSQHGTHVAGTALGDAGANDNTRGIAYGARMVYALHPDATEESMFAKFELHHVQGARVHSNSWGTDAHRDYDGGARGVDAFSFTYEDDLVLFAVTDFQPLVMNPENAKNCLAVYATLNSPNQNTWCFGGSGPTADGRQKPEIGAPGCSITSSTNSGACATTSLSGTSMACPAVAGVATLVRDYYTRGFYPSGLANTADAFTPSGSLIKATVLNAGVDLTTVAGFPSAREGWGRVLADNGVFFEGDAGRALARDVRTTSPGALETGLESLVRIAVESPSTPLRITLVWADYPALVNASFTPVNNLDLVVTAPNGATYLGNVFSGGVSVPGGSPDTLNNTEQVLISAPATGVWNVRVVGTAVNQGPQGYALLATGAVRDAGCLGDYNLDGNVDQDDVFALVNDIASGTASYPPNTPDINADGNVDQDDIAFLINLIASTGC
jgi:hypothetical protein